MDNAQLELDALKALHEARVSNQRFLAQRQFVATIQALTLNFVIAGTLALGSLELHTATRTLGSYLLVAVNSVVIIYLYQKRHNYLQNQTDLALVEGALISLCPLLEGKLQLTDVTKQWSVVRFLKFFDGTFLLSLTIVIAGLISIATLLLPLRQCKIGGVAVSPDSKYFAIGYSCAGGDAGYCRQYVDVDTTDPTESIIRGKQDHKATVFDASCNATVSFAWVNKSKLRIAYVWKKGGGRVSLNMLAKSFDGAIQIEFVERREARKARPAKARH